MNRRQPFFRMFTLAASGGDQRGPLLTQRAGDGSRQMHRTFFQFVSSALNSSTQKAQP
jgi:hypothetical protein